jgi:prophage regulatory protein
MVTTHDGAHRGPEAPDELLWNIKTVILKTGLSRPSIYRYMKRGRFPSRRRVGPNRVAWVPSEVVAWIETCPRLDGHPHGCQ